jgi:hypothetical protein
MGMRACMLALFLYAGALFRGASGHIMALDVYALGVPAMQLLVRQVSS